MKIIERTHYLNKIEHYFGKDYIIILTGQRRVGKSYMLRACKERLILHAEYNVIFIDKEKKEFDSIISYKDLNSYIEQQRKRGKRNFVLIDEVQDIIEFEKSLRSYYDPNMLFRLLL